MKISDNSESCSLVYVLSLLSGVGGGGGGRQSVVALGSEQKEPCIIAVLQ